VPKFTSGNRRLVCTQQLFLTVPYIANTRVSQLIAQVEVNYYLSWHYTSAARIMAD